MGERMTSSPRLIQIELPDGSMVGAPCEDMPRGSFHGWNGEFLSRIAAAGAQDAGLLERVGDGIRLQPRSGAHPEMRFVALVMRRSALARREATDLASSRGRRVRSRDVARSRSVISAAVRLLPASAREEAIDEWMDEVECAAEADVGTIGRTCSIVLRALPTAIWRAWRPARVPQRNS
jgi:hypothetical protein